MGKKIDAIHPLDQQPSTPHKSKKQSRSKPQKVYEKSLEIHCSLEETQEIKPVTKIKPASSSSFSQAFQKTMHAIEDFFLGRFSSRKIQDAPPASYIQEPISMEEISLETRSLTDWSIASTESHPLEEDLRDLCKNIHKIKDRTTSATTTSTNKSPEQLETLRELRSLKQKAILYEKEGKDACFAFEFEYEALAEKVKDYPTICSFGRKTASDFANRLLLLHELFPLEEIFENLTQLSQKLLILQGKELLSLNIATRDLLKLEKDASSANSAWNETKIEYFKAKKALHQSKLQKIQETLQKIELTLGKKTALLSSLGGVSLRSSYENCLDKLRKKASLMLVGKKEELLSRFCSKEKAPVHFFLAELFYHEEIGDRFPQYRNVKEDRTLPEHFKEALRALAES